MSCAIKNVVCRVCIRILCMMSMLDSIRSGKMLYAKVMLNDAAVKYAGYDAIVCEVMQDDGDSKNVYIYDEKMLLGTKDAVCDGRMLC